MWTLITNVNRAYCEAWGDGLDLTSSEDVGMCETSFRLKCCSAFPMG